MKLIILIVCTWWTYEYCLCMFQSILEFVVLLKSWSSAVYTCPTVWLSVKNGFGVENGFFIGNWIFINLFKFVQSVGWKVRILLELSGLAMRAVVNWANCLTLLHMTSMPCSSDAFSSSILNFIISAPNKCLAAARLDKYIINQGGGTPIYSALQSSSLVKMKVKGHHQKSRWSKV